MNVLLDTFPNKIEVNNKIYEIDSDFRNCLKIMLAFEDPELSLMEKNYIMCDLLYNEKIREGDEEEACKQAVKFLDCGEGKNDNESMEDNGVRLYSFKKDAKYIYNAIKVTHKIDLETIEYMHWWKFVYMFLDLDKDCFFNQIVYLRRQMSKGKLTKEEKQIWVEMRKILDLNYEEEQDESEFEILLKSGGTNEN